MTSIAGDPAVHRRAAAFDHPALFYRDNDDYLAGTLEFVHAGLSNGEAVAIAVPTARHDLLAIHLAAVADQIELVDLTRAGRNPGRIIGGVLRTFADRHPDRPVRIVAEPVWPTRSAIEYPACVQHEALVNRAFAGRLVTILCPYDTAALDPRIIQDAARTHPALIEHGVRRPSSDYAPEKALAGHNRPLTAPAEALRLRVGPGQLSWLREALTEHASAAGMSEDRQADWVLMLTELATNSIEHGGGKATVRLFSEAGQLVGQVRDSGRFLDPLAGRTPALPGQIRGRGLLIVNDIADLVRLHITRGATTLEVRLHID
jgi:anti-sigma regulatory factor (Ser/Thr protein kinase)